MSGGVVWRKISKESAIATGGTIGEPTDGSYGDGLLPFQAETKIADAVDDVNEILKELAPSNAGGLNEQNLIIYNNTTQKYSGRLSNSVSSNYKSIDLVGSSVNYIIKDAIFVLETPDNSSFINYGDDGSLEIYINDILKDSFDLYSSFDENYRDGNQIYPPVSSINGYITIQFVGKYNSFKKWQKVVADLNFTSSDFREGWNKIVLKHTVLSVEQASNDFDIYYDTDGNSNLPVLNTPIMSQNTLSSNKWLTGVRYYSINDIFNLSVIGTYMFKNVYLSTGNVVAYSGFIGVPNGNINISDGSVTGLSNPPGINDIMTVTNKFLTISVNDVCSNNARISCLPSDPYGSYNSIQSVSNNILISTFLDSLSGRSDDTNEYFSDEYYRLLSTYDFESKTDSCVDLWNSELSIGAIDNQSAQCYIVGSNHALVYPTINFSSGFLPSNSVNYSGFSGNANYYRTIIFSSAKNNMNIILYGVGSNIGQWGSNNINIAIKLPTQTAWLDCAKSYSSGDGVGVDGNGCLNGSIVYASGNATIAVTFGGKSTIDSGNRVYIRLILLNNNDSIRQMSIVA